MTSRYLFAGAFASAVAGAFLASMGAVQASTVYSYTGPSFVFIQDDDPPTGTYTTSMHVTGSFSVPAPLLSFSGFFVPDIFSFSDGRNTVTNLNATFAAFNLQTDASGMVLTWDIHVATSPGTNVGDQTFDIFTHGTTGVLGSGVDRGTVREVFDVSFFGGICCIIEFNNDVGSSRNFSDLSGSIPGTWSATPLPATLPLFATGLGALGLLGWRKRKKAAARAT